MDGHQFDFVRVVLVFLVGIGEQRHILQKTVEGGLEVGNHLTSLFVEGGLFGIFREVFHGIQQLFHIVGAVFLRRVGLQCRHNA